jgi:large subunit ribosomal protein L10
MDEKKKIKREKVIPENKVVTVNTLSNKMKSMKTLLLASSKGLPSSHYHSIKKDLRGIAEIYVAKRSLVLRSIEKAKNPGLQELKSHIGANISLMFSDKDAFELSGILTDNQSPAKAKAGDIAPEDIKVEPGPTDLPPGPAISELSSVGLKVSVEGGKLAIKLPATIVKQGQEIKPNVAAVMAKLNISPMKVGFEPLCAYDSTADKIYVGIKINKKAALEELRYSIGKSLGFAVSRSYPTRITLPFILAKAAMHEKAIESLLNKTQNNDKEDK